MPDLDLERRLRRLEDIEAIKQLKYRYWRHLDLKQWDELAELLRARGDGLLQLRQVRVHRRRGDHATSSASRSAQERGSVTIHHGHHPEIELLGDDRARGTWALYNYMFNVRENRGIRIGAYYDDRYVKLAGAWRFEHIGYRYIFHEEWKRDELASLTLR